MTRDPVPSYTGALADAPSPAARLDAADPRRRRFDEALRLMQDGCWSSSFTRLAELADSGYPQAARIALVFVRRGTSLFGGLFNASAEQRERWERAAATS